MLITQIKLESAFLGELPVDAKGVRRFKIDKTGRICVNQNFWLSQFELAARNSYGMHPLNIRGTVLPPTAITPASIHLYRRTYSGVHVEMFESFRKGTVLTFEMLLRDTLPGCPTCEQLQKILEFVGGWLGLSQFGSKFGFGRFRVLMLKDVNPRVPAPGPACASTPGQLTG